MRYLDFGKTLKSAKSALDNQVKSDTKPLLSILIVHFNTPGLLVEMFSAMKAALESISYEIIFVDNASDLPCRELVRELDPKVVFIQNKRNIGFGRANNQAFEASRGELILLLNTDTFVSQESISRSVEYLLEDHESGILGVLATGRDGSPQPSCRSFPTPLGKFLRLSGFGGDRGGRKTSSCACETGSGIVECDWVTGCFYLVKREVVETIGLFDPRYFLYFEEVDHCKRAKNAGWKVVCDLGVSVVHLGGESALASSRDGISNKQISKYQVESEVLYFRQHHRLPGVLTHFALTLVYYMLRITRRVFAGRLPNALQEIAEIKRFMGIFFATRAGKLNLH